MNKAAAEKSLARLVAVQALYSIDVSGEDAGSLEEFIDSYRGDDGEVDKSFAKKICKGVVEHIAELDEVIGRYLDKKWSLERMGAVQRSILRAAVLELKNYDTPSAVVIDEYVTITSSFFDEDDLGEEGFVNAILQNIAGEIRD